MDLSKVGDKDLYKLFGLPFDCTTAEIRKAYKKKALECHPDKNPDNPKAGELFNELREAVAILLDEKARATYDRALNARKAAELRNQQLDERRKKFKSDLEFRESQYSSGGGVRSEAEKLKNEISRLREEGARLLEREMYLFREEVNRALHKTGRGSGAIAKIKLEWTRKENEDRFYTDELLRNLFKKYGEITAIVSQFKNGKGKAIIEFKDRRAAELAMKIECGMLKCPLKLKWVHKDLMKNPNEGGSGESLVTERDYESLILRKMRQAEERKRLTEELKKEDEDSNKKSKEEDEN